MWQTVLVVLIVALAAGFVIRRLTRQLSGKNAACCGEGGGSCACSSAPQGRQGIQDLSPGGGGQACPHCAPSGGHTPPVAPEPQREDTK